MNSPTWFVASYRCTLQKDFIMTCYNGIYFMMAKIENESLKMQLVPVMDLANRHRTVLLSYLVSYSLGPCA